MKLFHFLATVTPSTRTLVEQRERERFVSCHENDCSIAFIVSRETKIRDTQPILPLLRKHVADRVSRETFLFFEQPTINRELIPKGDETTQL